MRWLPCHTGSKATARTGLSSARWHVHVACLVAAAAVLTVAGTEPYDLNAIGEAAATGDVDDVRSWLEQGTPVDAPDPAGRTAMHHAAANGYGYILDLLIEKGGDVNAKTATGHTPLHEAAQAGQLETAKILVAAGANKDATVSLSAH